jgi:C1A family cysteine protease
VISLWRNRLKRILYPADAFIVAALVLVIISPAFGQLTGADITALKQQAEEEGWTFTISENSATRYSLDELCGLKEPPNWRESARFVSFEPSKELPDSFDWRDEHVLPPAKQQGGCGSCWAFSTVGALECGIKIKDGMTVDLSEQWLVSCNQDGWGCDGGWFAHDYHEWKTDPCGGTGAVYESDFPYAASDLPCGCPYSHHYLIDSWAYVGNSYSIPSVDAIKQAIMDYGPVSVAVRANSVMQAYGGGIFTGCESGDINHAVVLVGWDDNQGANGVWFMRNSWGTGWGEDGGYMRIEYGCSSIGYAASFIDYPGSRSLSFDYPGGIPSLLTPGQATTFGVVVSGVSGGTQVLGSGQLHYAVDGGTVQTVSMNEIWPGNYEAALPSLSCASRVAFYVSAEETVIGRIYDPTPESPNLAVSATEVVVGFEDDFETDRGWTVSGDATDGQWDRGDPAGGGERGDPPSDFDGSGRCYLTDNVYGNSDVDGGTTTLTSPLLDLTEGHATIHFARWYSNNFGSAPYSDVMRIYVSDDNGGSWVLADSAGPTVQASGGWYECDFWVEDYISCTDQVRIRFDASDLGSGSVVEAAVDDVVVTLYKCGESAPVILTESLPDWTAGVPYSQQLEAYGGAGTLTWSDKHGDLTGTGLTLSAAGLLSGTPAQAGEIAFTAMVVDDSSASDEQFLTFAVSSEVLITTETLPDWTVERSYSLELQSSGGTEPVGWTDKFGDLAGTGLSLSSSGTVSGVPLMTGQISFTAVAADAVGSSDEKPFSFMINPHVAITTGSLPEWTVGIPYAYALEATGGTAPLSWVDKYGDLSGTGLSLSETGELTGTPASAGPISFTARISDVAGDYDEKPLSLTINDAVSILTTALPGGNEGESYSFQLESSGGTGQLAWSDKSDDLDGTGLTMSSIGLLSGTPTVFGTLSFTVRAEDGVGSYDERPFDLEIGPAFICGDLDGDEAINLLDVSFLIAYLYRDGPAPEPPQVADVDNSGEINLLDATYVINFLYKDGPPPNCPQ